ncbi:MAG: GNAT family N-acetyltransferase [Chloroflexi bacterium]|uniref:GNAT family N-acetyltransferase n=1 Tax=Candidatus Flexifilum breve TaxID=3140694 RepID=UPI003135EB93|nr:GNAT family N-acetyltransferase [Chloroflexota bacterium]
MTTTDLFDFSAFPRLTTPRLVLREVEPTDVEAVLALRSDPEVQHYNGEPMQSIDEAEKLVDDLRTIIFPNKYGIQWAVTEHGQDKLIGLFGLNYWDQHNRRLDLGYDLAHAHWGKGYAYEGLKAILDWGFANLNLNRIEAHVVDGNERSVRVLERLGFRLDGRRRAFSLEPDGQFHDSLIYGLLGADYVK